MKDKGMYRVNDFVYIDKIFSTENNVKGEMVKIKKPVLARVIHVEYTSLGPNYKLELLEDPKRSLKVRYWEQDILKHFDI